MRKLLGAGCVGLALFALCNGAPEPAHAPPAAPSVPPASLEALGTLRLSADAQAALGLELGSVEEVLVSESITVAGEVMIIPGRDIVLSAPTNGRIVARAGAAPRAGDRIEAGQQLLSLVPMATLERNAQASAGRDLETARANAALADARVNRASTMLLDRTGSERDLEAARAGQQVARAELRAAEARLRTIAGGVLDADVSLPIRSPLAGIVRAVRVAPEQSVTQGTALVDIAGTGRWVRATLAASDVRVASERGEARARRIGSLDGVPTPLVLTSPGPATALGTVDHFFALPNEADWIPGERVLLELRGNEPVRALSVALTAVVHDAEGGAWLYEQTAPDAFRRRRVEPIRREGDRLLLARGTARGARVVSTGAIELWGFELGADR